MRNPRSLYFAPGDLGGKGFNIEIFNNNNFFKFGRLLLVCFIDKCDPFKKKKK